MARKAKCDDVPATSRAETRGRHADDDTLRANKFAVLHRPTGKPAIWHRDMHGIYCNGPTYTQDEALAIVGREIQERLDEMCRGVK